jgi:hypothetical protein
MQMIQFMRIVNLIEMKSMKMIDQMQNAMEKELEYSMEAKYEQFPSSPPNQ